MHISKLSNTDVCHITIWRFSWHLFACLLLLILLKKTHFGLKLLKFSHSFSTFGIKVFCSFLPLHSCHKNLVLNLLWFNFFFCMDLQCLKVFMIAIKFCLSEIHHEIFNIVSCIKKFLVSCYKNPFVWFTPINNFVFKYLLVKYNSNSFL